MVRNQDKNKYQYLIHIILWIMFFILPFFIFSKNKEIDMWQSMMHHGITVISILFVFYLNFFVFIDRYLFKRKTWRYLLFNLLLVTAIGVLSHLSKELLPDIAFKGKIPPPIVSPFLVILFKDIFPLILIIGLCIAFKSTGKWYDLEMEYQEGEQRRIQAELQNLRQQINPHFLFNTLNNIYALIAMSPEKAQSAVLDLSKLLRYALYENTEEKVMLSKEIDFIANYVELMKIRQTNDVDIRLSIDSFKDSSLQIAPMLFISLIENAFKHGISPNKKSFVFIDVHLESERKLVCSISNSYFPKNDTDKSGSGIGLDNTKRRLNIIYPNKHTLEIKVSAMGYQTNLSILF